jgi:hypothetical protein
VYIADEHSAVHFRGGGPKLSTRHFEDEAARQASEIVSLRAEWLQLPFQAAGSIPVIVIPVCDVFSAGTLASEVALGADAGPAGQSQINDARNSRKQVGRGIFPVVDNDEFLARAGLALETSQREWDKAPPVGPPSM